MLAVLAIGTNADRPLDVLRCREVPKPIARPGWTIVNVKAGSLNLHDVWTLKGIGPHSDKRPRILGCDGSGVDENGSEVIVHSVIGEARGGLDETFDPNRSILSERHDGTFAEYVTVPTANLIPKPAAMSHAVAACLPTAWLTAYRMLFANADVNSGETILVQGATGGVGTAAVSLACAAGVRVFASTRDHSKHEILRELGVAEIVSPGDRLPHRVDAVIDSVGGSTWGHSLRSLRPGGRLVTCGASAGWDPPANLNHIFFRQLTVIGSTMGSRFEFERLLRFLADMEIAPRIDAEFALSDARRGFEHLLAGDHVGKIVLDATR